MKSRIKTDHLDVIPVLDESDAKVIYQAYRTETLPAGWDLPEGIKPVEFVEILDNHITSNYDFNWSVRKDGQPLCVCFAKDLTRYMMIGDMVWWPKTGKKAKVQAVAALLNEIRKDNVGLIEAEYEHKKFYELMVNHKILRRIGSLYDTFEKGSRTTFFQTRML